MKKREKEKVRRKKDNLDLDASICEYALAVEAITATTDRPFVGGLKVSISTTFYEQLFCT